MYHRPLSSQVETVASVVSVTHSPLKISLVLEDGSKLGGRIIAHRWYHDLDISGNASVREKNEAIGIMYVPRCFQGDIFYRHVQTTFLTIFGYFLLQ